MKTENEIRLQRSYWHGAFDMLNIPENAKSDKLNNEKITAQTWLAALDWMLSPSEESSGKTDKPEDKK